MNFIRTIFGTAPAPETPVQYWIIEEIPTLSEAGIINRSLLFTTTWENVRKYVRIPKGEITMSNYVVIVQISFRGNKTYETLTKEAFEAKWGKVPERSLARRSEILDTIGHGLKELLKGYEALRNNK